MCVFASAGKYCFLFVLFVLVSVGVGRDFVPLPAARCQLFSTGLVACSVVS